MKSVYHSYGAGEDIPVLPLLKKRKLFKYYSRETMAAVLSAGQLLSGNDVPADIPFYYASAEVENKEAYREIFIKYLKGYRGPFSPQQYLSAASPIHLFQTMRNMVPCFVSIENGLVGDNSVLVDTAGGLLLAGMTAPAPLVLLGAGYLHADGAVEAGFALMTPEECATHPLLREPEGRAIEIFR